MICLFPPTLCFSLPSSLPSPTDLFLFCLWLNFSRVSAGGSFGFTQDAASGSASAGGGGRLAFVFCLAFVCVFRYLFGFVCLRSPNRLGLVSTSEWGGILWDSLGFLEFSETLWTWFKILLDEFKSQANKNIKKHIRKKGNNNTNSQRFIEDSWPHFADSLNILRRIFIAIPFPDADFGMLRDSLQCVSSGYCVPLLSFFLSPFSPSRNSSEILPRSFQDPWRSFLRNGSVPQLLIYFLLLLFSHDFSGMGDARRFFGIPFLNFSIIIISILVFLACVVVQVVSPFPFIHLRKKSIQDYWWLRRPFVNDSL